jgi:hypothetical protein
VRVAAIALAAKEFFVKQTTPGPMFALQVVLQFSSTKGPAFWVLALTAVSQLLGVSTTYWLFCAAAPIAKWLLSHCSLSKR